MKITADKEQLNIERTLTSGQVFRYFPTEGGYTLYSGRRSCSLYVENDKSVVECFEGDGDYWRKYFDLESDYDEIISDFRDKPLVADALDSTRGIRILRQEPYEAIISFIISANNHIPRIRGIIDRLCRNLGEDMGTYHAFPCAETMALAGEKFYTSIGAGYRAKYLSAASEKIAGGFDISLPFGMSAKEGNKYLRSLMGVGEKVADCILLFAYCKTDVFPVDTWIKKVYRDIFEKDGVSPHVMRRELIELYGKYAGVAQQMLFYNKRSK